MPSPFATSEDHTKLWVEQSNYISTHVSAVGYGIHVAIFAMVTYYTIHLRHKQKGWLVWLTFNTLLFIIGTINLACGIKYNEDAWINERNYPGGPYSFIVEQQSRPVITLGNSAYIVAIFMADGLLLYRVMVVWGYTWYMIILPALLYVASLILAVIRVTQLALPSFLPSVGLSFPVWLILMIDNIFLTSMIAARLLLMRRKLRRVLGKGHADLYSGTAAIVIESALPFTIISIILLGLFGTRDTAQNLFIPLLVQMECIAPELIILRVMRGHAWSKNTLTAPGAPTTIVFANGARGMTDTDKTIENEASKIVKESKNFTITTV